MGEIFAKLDIEQAQLQEIEKSYRISRNEYFIAVLALSISIYNRRNDIKVSWNYNGRESIEYMTSIGLLFRELPVGIRFKQDMTIRDVFSDVQDQVRKGIEHCCYPYVDFIGEVATGESAYLLYQQDLRDTEALESEGIEVIDIRQNQMASQTILDIEILDGSDGLQAMIDFSSSWYEEKSIQIFTRIFAGTAELIARHDSQTDLTVGEIAHRIRREVLRETIAEDATDGRRKLEQIREKIKEAPHRHKNAGETAPDGPETRLDSVKEKVKEGEDRLDSLREKVREREELLRNFSVKFRKKR